MRDREGDGMRCRWGTGMIMIGVIAICAGSALAQDRNVSVKYLRAALGSISDRAPMSVEGL